MSDFDRAIEIKLTDSEGYYNRAIAYNNRGNLQLDLKSYAKAIADYDKALEIAPNLKVTRRNRTFAAQKLGSI